MNSLCFITITLLSFLPQSHTAELSSMQNTPDNLTIIIVPISTHQITFTDDILGMSFDDEGWPRLLAVSSTDDKLYSLEPFSADSIGELELNSGNQNGWGVAGLSDDLLYTNDTSDTFLYGYDSIAWFTQENYAGVLGRGMDYCEELFWQVASEGSLHRVVSWDLMSGIWTWSDLSSYIPGQLSGLTAFTSDTTTYLCVTTFNDADIWVFTTDNREIAEFVGTATLPETATTSLGLAYSVFTESFYWSYISGSDTYISQFEMIINQTSLETDTWGSLKALF